MRAGLELLLGLLDTDKPAHVSREDFEGVHGETLRIFQDAGFIASEPCMNPVPSCPHCFAGAPCRIETLYFCPRCGSEVDREDLWLWRLEVEPFLRWAASSLGLEGEMDRVDGGLWRLGTFGGNAERAECFYLRGENPTERALRRLRAFRSVIVFHGKADAPAISGVQARIVSLLELLTAGEGRLHCLPLAMFLRSGGRVRFDSDSGSLYAGDVSLGRVDLGVREFHLIECLAVRQGALVSYAELKQHVCGQTGSRDGTDEATFCQKLKARLKSRYRIAHVDRLIEKDARGGGYRLVTELSLGAGSASTAGG